MLGMQRNDVYNKYPKVGNSSNFFKLTHKNKPVVYQKQAGFKNNININKDNFINLLATFFVKVHLNGPQMNEILQYFSGCFACGYAGCSHAATGQIF